jgi:hypothetical protein
MRLVQHHVSRRLAACTTGMAGGVRSHQESRARAHAERFSRGGQVDFPRLARLDGIGKRNIDGRRQGHVLHDVHALASAAPGAHLCRSDSQRLGGVRFVPPPKEPEGGLEQGHSSEALLPAGLPSFRRARVVVRVGDRARVGEDGSLDVLERDSQKRSDAHDLTERRSPNTAEFPSLDRAGADADDLPQPGARIARRLAALLQQSGKSCLLDHCRVFSADRPLSQHTPLICGTRIPANRRERATDD